jgi:hypothetical protein
VILSVVLYGYAGMNIHLGYLREMCTKFYLGNLGEETTLKVLGKM